MAYAVKEDVQSVLGPFHERIGLVVERAWSEWRAVAAFRTEQQLDPVLYSRTVANYVFDAIARFAIAEFADDSSVHIRFEAQTVKFIFKGGVIARFKKGDENKLGRNNTTQSVLDFVEAEALLPGLPPETAKVEFIWIANDIQTRLDQVLVVARDAERLLWDYEIQLGTEKGVGTVIPFPLPAADMNPPSNDTLVKPKATPSKKNAEQE